MNNKGGVGKTTLLCNLAHHLAAIEEKQVLILDIDPQCNATQLLLSDDDWDAIYGGDQRRTGSRTILHALRNIQRGDSGVEVDSRIYRSDRFKVDVVPGHPSMALLEDRLSSSWEALLRGDLGGARRSHWLRELVHAHEGYDYVLIDAGPSLGALNRTVLLGADVFVTPTSADLFSVYALDNIRTWIRAWSRSYEHGMLIVEEDFPDEIIWQRAGGSPSARLLGYTIQQYVTKAMRDGLRRRTNAYDHYSQQIPLRAVHLAEETGTSAVANLDLGTVPYMFSMVPLAQARHAPIAGLTTADGLRGAQISQQSKYREQLEQLGNRLVKRLAEEAVI